MYKRNYNLGGNMNSEDEYGTFEIYKRGGKVQVEIVNKEMKFDKDRYRWLLNDFDRDGTANVDDQDPYNRKNNELVDTPSLKKGLTYLLDLKRTMDKNMYSFVRKLKDVAPSESKIYARTKTPYSIINKLILKRLLNPKTGLTDLIGTTIVVKNRSELEKVKNEISSGKLGKVIELEDMYANPKDGYRAYHFLIEMNNMPVELQLKTARQKALNELSHEPYKLGELDGDKLIKMTEIADQADNGDRLASKQYDEFMNQPNIERAFYISRPSKMSMGGTTENYESLVGRWVSLYSMGVKLPTAYTIQTARMTPAKFDNRELIISFDNETEERIPLSKVDSFIRGEEVVLRTSKGESYVLQLMQGQSKRKMAKGGNLEPVSFEELERMLEMQNSYKFGKGGSTQSADGHTKSFSEYLSNEEEVRWHLKGIKLSKQDVVDFMSLSKNSEHKYFVRGKSWGSYWIFRGELRLNDSVNGIFLTSLTSPKVLPDDGEYYIWEEKVTDKERAFDPDKYKFAIESIHKKFSDVYDIETSDKNKLVAYQVRYQKEPYEKYYSLPTWEEAYAKFKRSLTKDELDSIEISFKKEEFADVEEHDTDIYYREITVRRKNLSLGGALMMAEGAKRIAPKTMDAMDERMAQRAKRKSFWERMNETGNEPQS